MEQFKKKRSKETGIARCTDLLNDQTLDKVTRTDSETDFSSTESALWNDMRVKSITFQFQKSWQKHKDLRSKFLGVSRAEIRTFLNIDKSNHR